MKTTRNNSIKKILIIILALLISSFIGYRFALAQSGNALKSVVEPGSMTTEASYIIFTDGTNYYARNGTTGEIEFSSTNASQVINNAIGNTPSYGTVVLKGNITITNTIVLNKPLTFVFDILIFDRSLSGNGINITNHDNQVKVIGQAIWAFPAGSPYSPWNNAAICITGLSSSAFIEVGAITYWPQPQQGFGIELYAGPEGWVEASTIENTMVSYFSTNIYLHCDSTGWVNRNTFDNVFVDGGSNYNIRLYNNGDGIGANTFVNCWSEPPNNATGYNIWMGSSGTQVYHWLEYNEFDNFVSYDIMNVPTKIDFYADSTVLNVKFVGGMLPVLYTSQWQDNGLSTAILGHPLKWLAVTKLNGTSTRECYFKRYNENGTWDASWTDTLGYGNINSTVTSYVTSDDLLVITMFNGSAWYVSTWNLATLTKVMDWTDITSG